MDRRLRFAVSAAVVEVVGQMVLAAARGALGGAPLRVVFLLAKLPFCWLAWRRNAAGYLVVMAYEFAGIVAAVATGSWLVGVVAGVVMALLGRASSALPTVEWKR